MSLAERGGLKPPVLYSPRFTGEIGAILYIWASFEILTLRHREAL